MAAGKRKLISIVTPCYNEELNVPDCYEAVRKLFANELADYDYEHIFCDNASSDATVMLLRQLADVDPHVKVILNARNFGPFRSMFNGLLSTTGDAVVPFLPADLQDPAEVIVSFVRHWEAGHKIVYGIRANRQEGLLMRTARSIYYRLVNRFANIEIPRDVGEFQLIDRAVVEALRQCDDYYPYLRGLISHCGYQSVGVSYTWKARQKGMSKNRLYHLFDQALNGLISFTNLPMRLCLVLGLSIAGLSLGYSIFTVISGLIYYRELAPPGIPTLIAALFFFSGVQLAFMGILGEYISAIHFQVRKRPLVVERERVNFGKVVKRTENESQYALAASAGE
jgi:glycosyltransferase involved in cell wall biosynthesis